MAMTLTEKRARRTERAESKRRIEQAQKETRAIVTTGSCPGMRIGSATEPGTNRLVAVRSVRR